MPCQQLLFKVLATWSGCGAAGQTWWTWHRTHPYSLGRTLRCSQSRPAGDRHHRQHSGLQTPFKLTTQSMGEQPRTATWAVAVTVAPVQFIPEKRMSHCNITDACACAASLWIY